MAVISLRLNENEEKIIKYLVNYFEEDKSTLIKHSLRDLYEDLKDREVIEEYEEKRKRGKKITFVTSEKAMKLLKL